MTPPVGAMNCIPPAKRGFLFLTVLVITAVGLLFGAGALLLFRYQCQMRIDRQHELEKIYAVRSVLNYIRTYDDNKIDEGMPFRYYTTSGRDLGLIVKHVEPNFPSSEKGHFDMERIDFKVKDQDRIVCKCENSDDHYNLDYDYEYGAIGVTNLLISTVSYQGYNGLKFGDLTEKNKVRWWVNIGMRGIGGWLEADYGRRYFFYPGAYVNHCDTMRLCLIRNVTNHAVDVTAGWKHGWPLSMKGERAIVFETRPFGNSDDAEVTLWEYVHNGKSIETKKLSEPVVFPSKHVMGLQIANNKISVFNIENAANDTHSLSSRGYTLCLPIDLPSGTYKYFAEECEIGGTIYGGTNIVNGKVHAPELRAVFEVEADPVLRGPSINAGQLDFLTKFMVTPAYQYDVLLEHPACVTNRATVAQKIGEWQRKGTSYSIRTYDTHGTEHKGFRKDEKDFEESKRKNGH